MSAKFIYRGIPVEVPVSELAEAMRQLGLMPDATGMPPMSGADIMRSAGLPLPSTSSQERPRTDLETVFNFLRFVEEYGTSGGANIVGVMTVLNVNDPKGVGPKSGAINRVLSSYGFEPEDVYINPKDSGGERLWRPGPRLKEAIQVIGKEVVLA